jgi:acetyl esterase/lipase
LARVALAAKPRRYSRVLQVPSFFISWFYTEATLPLLLLHLFRAKRSLRADRGNPVESALTGCLDAAAAAGMVSFIGEGFRAGDEMAAALSPWLSEADLAGRPRAHPLLQWVPLLHGARRPVIRTRNICFTSDDADHRLCLDVYQPQADPPGDGSLRPAIIEIHGGAWVIGDKREQGLPLLNHLAANGWVGFTVNYTLSPKAKAPQHLIDCKVALAWVREHAAEYGIDPNFICVTGGSAGGHLAALMALTANDPAFQPGFEDVDTSVAAAVPFYGVYDLVDDDHLMITGFRQNVLERLMFPETFDTDDLPYRAYSPQQRIHAAAPPTLIVHGTRDALVPVEVARRFAAELGRTSDHAVAYAELQGAQHAFEIFHSPRTVRVIEHVERFLDGVRRGVIK